MQKLQNKVLETLGEVKTTDSNFKVSDLFRGFEWNRVERGLRIQLGAWFYAEVTGIRIKGVQALGKTPQNQQLYKKTID